MSLSVFVIEAQAAAPASSDVLVFEYSTATPQGSWMLEENDNYYLPVSFLAHLDFELKELGGNVVGMCQDCRGVTDSRPCPAQ